MTRAPKGALAGTFFGALGGAEEEGFGSAPRFMRALPSHGSCLFNLGNWSIAVMIATHHESDRSPRLHLRSSAVFISLLFATTLLGCGGAESRRSNATWEYCQHKQEITRGLSSNPRKTATTVDAFVVGCRTRSAALRESISSVANLAVVDVDEKVVELSQRQMQLWVREASLCRDWDLWMNDSINSQSWTSFAAGGLDAFISGLKGDVFGAINRSSAEAEDMQRRWRELETRSSAIDEEISAFSVEQTALRLDLAKRYGREFPL